MVDVVEAGIRSREFRMSWEAQTPVLTASVARSAALALGFVFALILGAAWMLNPGAPGTALLAGAVGAGVAALILAVAVFGLMSNRIRKRFTVTHLGYASEIANPRLAPLIPGAGRSVELHSWDGVERVRLDAEYGRVLVRLRTGGWDSIHCPDGRFVATAREIRRLIDEAQAVAPTSLPAAWKAVRPAPSVQRRLPETTA